MRDENQIFAEYIVAQGVDKRALEEELLKALARHAHAVCWMVMHEHAPDIVNWALHIALTNADKFRGEAKFSSWFHTIVQNLCYRTLAQRKKEIALDALDPKDQEVLAQQVDIDPQIDVHRLLAELRGEDRRLVEMRLEGLNFEEIGERLGVGMAAAKERWHRIKKQLQ